MIIFGDGTSFWYTDGTSGESISYTWADNVYIGYLSFYRFLDNSFSIEYKKGNEWIKLQDYSSNNSYTTEFTELYLPNIIKTNSIRFKYDVGSAGFLGAVNALGLREVD